jgi:hypothetical protein
MKNLIYYRMILASIAITAVITALLAFNIFSATNGAWYNFYSKYNISGKNTPQIIIINDFYSAPNLSEKLAAYNPKKIILLEAGNNLAIPTMDAGVYKTYPYVTVKNGHKYETAEVNLVKDLNNNIAQNGDNFLVNFGKIKGNFPIINASDTDALPAEFFQGKIILINTNVAESAKLLVTPISKTDGISLSEYRAFAIETLLEDNAITQTGMVFNALLVFITALGSLFLYQQLSIKKIISCTALICIFFAAFGWLSHNFMNLFLPVDELQVATLICSIIIGRLKVLDNEEIISFLYREAYVKMLNQQENPMPKSYMPALALEPFNSSYLKIKEYIDYLEETLSLRNPANDHESDHNIYPLPLKKKTSIEDKQSENVPQLKQNIA